VGARGCVWVRELAQVCASTASRQACMHARTFGKVMQVLGGLARVWSLRHVSCVYGDTCHACMETKPRVPMTRGRRSWTPRSEKPKSKSKRRCPRRPPPSRWWRWTRCDHASYFSPVLRLVCIDAQYVLFASTCATPRPCHDELQSVVT
jgi:cytochrome c5